MSRTLVMGIVNVTPDSFSDGGEHATVPAAVAHARRLLDEGVDILDIGGESTRPGAERPSLAEELRRVVPVVEELAATGAVVSVDTMRAVVARASMAAGASIINDVSGGLADDQMVPVVARAGADFVCMHWRGFLGSGHTRADYTDVVTEVLAELTERLDACVAGGIAPEKLVSDIGFGFSKTAEQNWELLRHLDAFQALGYRQLVGVSRKRFLGELLDGREPTGRDAATAAVTAICAQQGIWAVRTHSVQDHRDVIAVVERMASSSGVDSAGGNL